MVEELTYSLKKLNDAFDKLKEGAGEASGELERDGVIQRFEFTFELMWKSLKLFLREKGVDTKTPKDSLQEAFRVGWIKDEAGFLQMLEDRNTTSHIYKKKLADEIFERIKGRYLGLIEQVIETLREQIR